MSIFATCQHGVMLIACDDSTIWESGKYGVKFYGKIPQGKVP